MILNIIWKEIKYQLKNITFYGFFIVILLMFFSQLGIPKVNDLTLIKQKENFYRTEKITDKDKEMKQLYLFLNNDYAKGTVQKYKTVFGYNVKLNDSGKDYLKAVIDKIYTFDSENNLKIKVSYNEYLDLLRDLDKKLKGNTIYGDNYRSGILNEATSLQKAVKTFNDVMRKDKFTNAYGRLFADYMGITAGFFPVFLSAFIFIREKNKKEYEKIYSSKLSFTKYILAKYIGICICIMGCYFILATYTTLAYSKFALDTNYVIDRMAIYKYTFAWIAPTVLFTTAFGILTAAIFNNRIAAIAAQLILWSISIQDLIGYYGLTNYVIRFNEFGQYDKYLQFRTTIIENRIFYTLISFVVVLLGAHVWTKFREKGTYS